MSKKIKSILRSIEIDLMLDTQTNPVTHWFNDFVNELFIVEVDVYQSGGGEFIYYIVEHGIPRCVFWQSNKNDVFWYDSSYMQQVILHKIDTTLYFALVLIKILLNHAIVNDLLPEIKYGKNKPRLLNHTQDKVMTSGTLIGDALNGTFIQKD